MSQHRTIGILVPRLEGDYFTRVVLGVQRVIRQRGHQLLVVTGSPQTVVETGIARNRVDAWIVVVRTEGIEALARSGVPVVTIATIAPNGTFPAVLPDNRAGMAAAVKHLIEHGHQRIGFIGGMANVDVQQRFEGYQTALREAGIPFDEQLLFAVDSNQEQGGRAAAERLIEQDIAATALATATDDLAFGAIDILTAHSVRVPEDMAIVSFDDVERAQQFTPPLTTVRQRPDELGRVAVDIVLRALAGETNQVVTYVPTALIIRQSCGCSAAPVIGTAAVSGSQSSADWRTGLANRLVQIALHPLPFRSDVGAETIWPGARDLAHGLDAALVGSPVPSAEVVEQAWQEANELTFDLEALNRMFSALDRTAQEQLNAPHSEAAAYDRVHDYLDRVRLAMLRARVTRETQLTRYFEQVARQNYIISMRLLGRDMNRAYELSWLDLTTVLQACLGFWGETESARTLSVAGVFGNGMANVWARQLPSEEFPPAEIFRASGAADQAGIVLALPLRSETRDWGVLALHAVFENQIDGENLIMWARLLSTALERGELMTSMTAQREQLAGQQADLQIAYDRERALADTVRELGSPVILLLPGVLLVPLIGAIDSYRAQDITSHILEGVQEHHARVVLLDVTGVSLIDTQIANSLIQTAQAITLLGAQAVMVGMRPEIAQSIIGLGLDLSILATESSLASAIQRLQRRGGRGW